jgi:Mrp family chromosome partitioning ATPase
MAEVTPLRRAPIPGHTLTHIEAERRLDGEHLVRRRLLEGCRRASQRIDGVNLTSIGVTSALRGEGRSSVAAGLAMVQWLDHERRTVLVDLDLDKPSLHEHFGLELGPGIGELADGHEDLEEHLQRIVGNLWLLSAGRSRDDSPRVLSRLNGSRLMSQISELADVVVYDLPPLLASSTGLEASRLCDNKVLVVRAAVTPLPRVREAASLLETPPPVILNGARSFVPTRLRRMIGDWS